MRNLLVFLGLVLLLSVLSSCESRSHKLEKKVDGIINEFDEKIFDEPEVYTIKDGVLIVDEVFTIKTKYTGDKSDIVYTLYKFV